MESEVEQNKQAGCTRTSCRKRSVCCDCVRKHVACQQMPECWKDYDPSTSVMVCIRGTLTAVDIGKLKRNEENLQTGNDNLDFSLCPLARRKPKRM